MSELSEAQEALRARMADAERKSELPEPLAVNEVRIRCVDPGARGPAIFAPLVRTLEAAGVTVSSVHTVTEADVYEEGILPPVLTIYVGEDTLAGNAEIVGTLSTAVKSVLAEYRSLNLNGYGTPGAEFRETSDVAVFVHCGSALAKCYMKPNEYAEQALRTIPAALRSSMFREFIANRRPPLGYIIMWDQGRWRAFPGKGGLIALTDPAPSATKPWWRFW